jgi:large subunit ribosomal protein L22
MELTAKARYIHMSPRKIRLAANLIKGLAYEPATVQLQFLKKAATVPLLKLLKSAMHNAEENHELKRNNLRVKVIKVDEGPALKRWMPRAMGRATPLRKMSSHITLVLEEIVPTEPSGKGKNKVKKTDDLIKIGDIDEIKDKEVKEDKVGFDGKKLATSKRGFGSKVLNRRTGQK